MPLYEYKCQTCGKVFEALQKFADEPLKLHENCGGPVERLISSTSFQFKGTGWYVTDYARKGNGSNKDGKSSPESKPAAAKTEPAKPAASEPASSKP